MSLDTRRRTRHGARVCRRHDRRTHDEVGGARSTRRLARGSATCSASPAAALTAHRALRRLRGSPLRECRFPARGNPRQANPRRPRSSRAWKTPVTGAPWPALGTHGEVYGDGARVNGERRPPSPWVATRGYHHDTRL